MVGRSNNRWLSLAMVASSLAADLVSACDSNRFAAPDAGSSPGAKADAGALQITGSTNNCPAVVITLSPPDTTVGGKVTLSAVASDPEGTAALTYHWSASSGAFGDDATVSPFYSCTTAGAQTIRVAVSDGLCTTVTSITVFCVGQPGSSGSGGVANASGGAPGAGGRAGSGGVKGSGGASGSGMTAATGGVKGSGGSSGSGGIVATGGTTIATGGNSAGTGGSAPRTGGVTGTTGSGGVTGSGGATSAMCSGDPTMDEGAACNTCTDDNCYAMTDGCSLALMGSDAKRQKCLALYCCLRANGCMGGDPTKCWCGDAPRAECVSKAGPAKANGRCLREFVDAGETDDPSILVQRLVDPGYAVGGADNLAICRATFCSRYSDPASDACRL